MDVNMTNQTDCKNKSVKEPRSFTQMKKVGYLLSLLFLCVLVTGCKKNSQKDNSIIILPTLTPTIEPTVTPIITPEVNREGQAISKLTGLWVEEEIANQRPFAVMLNNIRVANPQSGIGDAVILYEALVEGGITRLMGIFEGIDKTTKTAERIGSVRSARHYYVSFADEYDAIFVHYGQTSYAIKKIKKLGIDTISGMEGVGVNSFYRDKSIKAPHNAFLSLDGIQRALEKGKLRTTYEEGYQGHYQFYDSDKDLVGASLAGKVTLKFSSTAKPYFIYDSNTKEYLRYQYDDKHIDANTSEQLTYKNLIVQFVKEWNIDKNGYQTMDIEDASGEGYYFTNGSFIPITWKKNESTRFMKYYNKSGEELIINPGKTYIGVFPDNHVSDVMIE
ncbi:DUF3048 domain-containing protein [Lachnoclostridium sp.]|uniref:DUF3048 domain-containing protein n=1 Tax=Lachnoclostridium sp. TaxID=2028282 RepID=UPI00289EC897|nr:DUF3048 domain-containing protein [Lachnoclostridium sp.]